MEIVELHKITVDEAAQVISLMYQLNPDIPRSLGFRQKDTNVYTIKVNEA